MRSLRDSIGSSLRELPGRRLRRGAAVMLLPLSAVPVAIAAPRVVENYEAYSDTYLNREALAAPGDVLSAAERRLYAPTRANGGRIPVLAYHGIADSADGYSVTQERFAAHMAMLDRAGYESVSAKQYARVLAGEDVELPERPILITFDDGRTNSFRGADAVLEQHGFRATIFVTADKADEKTPTFLRWDELRDMAGSDRWDVQLHAGSGHREIPSGPGGRIGPFYANRAWRDGREESRPDAYRRITTDIAWGAKKLREQIPGSGTWAFAVPFGNYGADGQGNDARLSRQVGGWLKQRYAATFVQSERPRLAGAGDAHRVVHRRPIHTGTTAASLYRWLCACALSKERS